MSVEKKDHSTRNKIVGGVVTLVLLPSFGYLYFKAGGEAEVCSQPWSPKIERVCEPKYKPVTLEEAVDAIDAFNRATRDEGSIDGFFASRMQPRDAHSVAEDRAYVEGSFERRDLVMRNAEVVREPGVNMFRTTAQEFMTTSPQPFPNETGHHVDNNDTFTETFHLVRDEVDPSKVWLQAPENVKTHNGGRNDAVPFDTIRDGHYHTAGTLTVENRRDPATDYHPGKRVVGICRWSADGDGDDPHKTGILTRYGWVRLDAVKARRSLSDFATCDVPEPPQR